MVTFSVPTAQNRKKLITMLQRDGSFVTFSAKCLAGSIILCTFAALINKFNAYAKEIKRN